MQPVSNGRSLFGSILCNALIQRCFISGSFGRLSREGRQLLCDVSVKGLIGAAGQHVMHAPTVICNVLTNGMTQDPLAAIGTFSAYTFEPCCNDFNQSKMFSLI